jgi:hypothetical protein
MGLFLLVAFFLFPALFFLSQPFLPFLHLSVGSLRFSRDLV